MRIFEIIQFFTVFHAKKIKIKKKVNIIYALLNESI